MVLAVLLECFLHSHNTLLQRKTFIIQNLGGWKASWKGWIFFLSRLILYQHAELKPGGNTERSSVSTINFQESERRSEMFNKVVRKDCRLLCNHLTSGPQAFRKTLDSRKKLAWSMEKFHIFVLCLYHETFHQATHTGRSTVKQKINESNLSKSWQQGNIKGKLKLWVGGTQEFLLVALWIILSVSADPMWQITAEMFAGDSAPSSRK